MRCPTTLAALAAMIFCDCSYDWDSTRSPVTLVGSPPPHASLQKLNRQTAGTAIPMSYPSGAPWVAFCETWRQGPYGVRRGCIGARLVRLAGAAYDEVVTGDEIAVRSTAVYLMNDLDARQQRSVTLHRPGRGDVASFLFRAGPAKLVIADAGNDDVFLYWVQDPNTTTYVVRREHGAGREFGVPRGVDPAAPDATMQFLFARGGDLLVTRAADKQVTVWSTSGGPDYPLGVRSPLLAIDEGRSAILTSGDDGLRSVPLAGGADTPLADTGYDAGSLRVIDDAIWFTRKGDIYRVLLDGSRPPQLVQAGAARLLALPSGWPGDARLIYSHDDASRYAGGAGDGWLGGWGFMERGRRVRFSLDGRRIFFLEHAARTGVVGDLEMADTAAAAAGPQLLARNVHQYDELPDGRALAVENHAFTGDWNRLVAIDPVALTARWVAEATHEYLLLPGGEEAVIDAVSGASGYDIYRVPIPR